MRHGFFGIRAGVLALGAALAASVAAGAEAELADGVLTLDGIVTNVTSEADLGEEVAKVVMKNGGGVAFSSAATLAKTYEIAGDGLSATGVVSVADGATVVASADALGRGTVGHVLVKKGAGTLQLTSLGVVSTPTRWIAEEGVLYTAGANMFGNHSSTSTNLVIDVREGATYTKDGYHSPMGPLELTGGRFSMPLGSEATPWGVTAFRGGVVAHACDTVSCIAITGHVHLNHVYTNVPFTVERGATLEVRGILSDGMNTTQYDKVPNRMIVSGGGELRLYGRSRFTGGAELNDGAYVLGAENALGTGPVAVKGEVSMDVADGVAVYAADVSAMTRLEKRGSGFLCISDNARSAGELVVTAGGVSVPSLDVLPAATTFAEGTAIGLGELTAETILSALAAHPGIASVYAMNDATVDALAFDSPRDSLAIGVWRGATLSVGEVSGVADLRVVGSGWTTLGSVAEGTTVYVGTNSIARVPQDAAVAADSAGAVYRGDATEATLECLHLPGGDFTIDVPAGLTLVVESVSLADGATKGALFKTGAGTLVLPPGRSGAFGALYVQDGVAVTTAYGSMNDGETTVSGGATLRMAVSVTQYWPVTVSGAGTIDVPEGVSVAMSSNVLATANATFTKTGAGTLSVGEGTASKTKSENAHWIVAEGTLRLPGDSMFGQHRDYPTALVEVLSGAVLESDGHNVFGDVTLRGGTLFNRAFKAQATNTLERIFRWGAFSLNGTVTALPSPDGRPSRIDSASYVLLGNGAHTTTFDVRKDAVLEVSAHLQPGENAEATAMRTADMVKGGAGELVLLTACGAQGTVRVLDGVVTLGPDARFAPEATLDVSPGAKVRLMDGALLATRTTAPGALLASADVWLDASRIIASDGATVSSVPNLGTAGGEFAPFTWATSPRVLPDVPTFAKNGIDGKGTLTFNGGQALVLQSYTNRSTAVEVFFVGEWSKWRSDYYASPFSLGRRGMTVNDYGERGGVSYQHKCHRNEATGNYEDLGLGTFVTLPSDVRLTIPSLVAKTPYFVATSRGGGSLTTTAFTSDEEGDVSVSAAANWPVDIDVVCVGGRLDPGAEAIVHSTAVGKDGFTVDGNNRMFIGRVGELVVFSRTLTDDERAAVSAYLKSKWLGSAAKPAATASAASSACDAGAVEGRAGLVSVAVPEGARAAVAGTVGAQTGDGESVVFAKDGAGTLDFVASASGAGVVAIDEGAVVLPEGGRIASRADVWFDATDAAAVELDADGKVASVANKGRCGGAFAQAVGSYNAAVPKPSYVADGIGGRPAVAFNSNSALMLDSYTNVGWRSQHVYAVMRRTKWICYCGPYSFSSASATNTDNVVSGSMHLEESSYESVKFFLGSGRVGEYSRGYDATGVDLLHVTHQYPVHGSCAFERAEDDTNNVAIYRLYPAASSNVIDRLALGGRLGGGGAVQWHGMDNGNNRMWHGRIGEFIVFRQQLNHSEECALLAYLRKKWLDKGTGSETPPAFLSGEYGEGDLSSAGLAMADGTRLVHAQTTRAVASVATEGTVDWTRVWDGASGEGMSLFDVSGDASLSAIRLDLRPGATSGKVFGIAGETIGKPAWAVFAEGRPSSSTVVRRAGGWWLSPSGTILIFR